jgi:hypothetical protein
VRRSRISSNNLLGGGAADVGLRTRAETSCHPHTHLDDLFGAGARHGERLSVGVGDDEVDALEPGVDHVVDGVATRAADTEDGDPRLQFADVEFLRVDVHGLPLLLRERGSP